MNNFNKNIIMFMALFFLNSVFCFAMKTENNCTICMSNILINVQLLPCKHEFCLDCIKKHHKSTLKTNIKRTYNFLMPTCPVCRTPFNELKAIGNAEYEIVNAFSFEPYKTETRDEKLCVLTNLKFPEIIEKAKKNLIASGIATEENVSQLIEDDGILYKLYKGFLNMIKDLPDNQLIDFIHNTLEASI